MTRFFSQVILEDDGGTLQAVRRGDVRRLSAVAVAAVVAGCGSGCNDRPRTSAAGAGAGAAADERARHGRRRQHPGAGSRRSRQGRRPLGAHESRRRRAHPAAPPRCPRHTSPRRRVPVEIGAPAIPNPPAVDGRPLPAVAPVADVRRRPKPRAVADRDSSAAAVPGDLGTRCRVADRVSGGRLGGDGVHRQPPRHGHGDRDGRRPRALEAPPARRQDGVVAGGLGRSARRPRDGRRRPSPRPFDRPPARTFAIGSPVESSPVVRDGIDYFGAWNGRVYALDLHNMRLRWTVTPGCKITSSVAIAGGTIYIGDYCGRLLALARDDGP